VAWIHAVLYAPSGAGVLFGVGVFVHSLASSDVRNQLCELVRAEPEEDLLRTFQRRGVNQLQLREDAMAANQPCELSNNL
jgi:hypothetical protein